ncbi:MAG: glycosyltransferase [Silicimonas sp.]|nr:glycosyltransferase [Silicimonas sp.]
MVKEPRAGRVKTRLGADIGLTNAAWWYRHQVARSLRNLRDPRWQILLAVAPDTSLRKPLWPADLPRLAQGGGDLGQRMKRALAATPGPSLLIGSDIPGIRRHHIARGFRALGQAASVIGPAPDGGYWLVGLKHPGRAPRTLFENVRWSHPETRADTLPTLPGPTTMIDMLRDVDTAADL